MTNSYKSDKKIDLIGSTPKYLRLSFRTVSTVFVNALRIRHLSALDHISSNRSKKLVCFTKMKNNFHLCETALLFGTVWLYLNTSPEVISEMFKTLKNCSLLTSIVTAKSSIRYPMLQKNKNIIKFVKSITPLLITLKLQG